MNFYTVPKNADVVAAWTRGATANTAHLSTNGHDLYSYALRIGTTPPNGRKIVGQFDASNEFHSMTTSHHVGIARRVADAVVEPETMRAMWRDNGGDTAAAEFDASPGASGTIPSSWVK